MIIKSPNTSPITEPRIGCIATALTVLGQKWTALIIRDLCCGPKRFLDLEQSVKGINPRTLSQRLQSLKNQGIVRRSLAGDRVTYSLTAKGKDLVPIIRQMAAWGDKYFDECA